MAVPSGAGACWFGWSRVEDIDSLCAMSTLVFGALILFVIASMIHFLHEWWDARRGRDSKVPGDRGP